MKSLEKSGMCGCLGKTIVDTPAYGRKQMMRPGMIEDGDRSLGETIQMFDRWNGKELGSLEQGKLADIALVKPWAGELVGKSRSLCFNT